MSPECLPGIRITAMPYNKGTPYIMQKGSRGLRILNIGTTKLKK